MDGITVEHAEEIPAYEGEHEIPGIRFRHAGQQLGISAWGMNVIDLDAGITDYPEHHHTADGQEELYVVLRGEIVLQAGGEERVLKQGHMVRVAPEVPRKFVTRGSAATILALGGTPGKPYSPSWGG